MSGTAGLVVQRLARGLQRFRDADSINDHIVGLAARGGGRDFLQIVMVEGAGAAALHLLEIVAAPHVAHEQQAFQRLHVGARGDHVHRHGDARIVVVAELRQDGFRVFVGPVGDLLAKLVALAEFLAHGLDDVVGVAVGLGEDQCLRNFAAARKYRRQLVAEGTDNRAYLIRVDEIAVKFPNAVGDIRILSLPAAAARQSLALLDLLIQLELAAVPGRLGLDDIDLVADIDAVGDRLLMAVFADHVLLEEPIGAVIRRGGQTDEKGVEVLQHLTPQVVNRAMTLVDDDEIEELGWNLAAIDHRHRFLGPNLQLCGIDLFGSLVQLLALQERIHALDGADADLAIPADKGRLEALNTVKLGELAVVVAGHVGHERLFGLFAQIPCVHEKQDALGVGMFE